jgi:hypothetical protein
MANIAKNQTQDKLATILAEYPQLRAFIEEGKNLNFLENIVHRLDDVEFIPKKAMRDISKIVKLGARREITRTDLHAAYCLGKKEAMLYVLSRLDVMVEKSRPTEEERAEK